MKDDELKIPPRSEAATPSGGASAPTDGMRSGDRVPSVDEAKPSRGALFAIGGLLAGAIGTMIGLGISGVNADANVRMARALEVIASRCPAPSVAPAAEETRGVIAAEEAR